MKFINTVSILLVVSLLHVTQSIDETITGYHPKAGMIPNAKVASSIAEAYLRSAYPRSDISGELPLIATMKDGIWIVRGQLPEGTLGGVGEIHMRKSDGKVLHLTHGR